MIKYIDGVLHIIDDCEFFCSQVDNNLPELQYALTRAIDALSSEEYHNSSAVEVLTDLLRLTFPTRQQARFLRHLPDESEDKTA